MKSKFFLVFCFVCSFASAQIYTPTSSGTSSNDNVGIGESSPDARLEINSAGTTGLLQLNYTEAAAIGGGTTVPDYAIKIIKTPDGLTPYTSFLLGGEGQMYLGNLTGFTNTTTKLNIRHSMGIFNSDNNYLDVDYSANEFKFDWNNTGLGNWSFNSITSTGTENLLTLASDGKVGLGTSTMNGDYRLYVAGKILAEELTVKLVQDWPDYVFKSDYKRLSLAETEAFINENGHLPKIPSAEEVAENGVDLGEMNRLLLEKVEELTLELIELQKEVNELKSK